PRGTWAPYQSAESVCRRHWLVQPVHIPTRAASSSRYVRWCEGAASIPRRHGAALPSRNPIRGEPGSCPERGKSPRLPAIAVGCPIRAPIFRRAEAGGDQSAGLSYLAPGLYQPPVEMLRLMYRALNGEELGYSPPARLTEPQ